MKLTFLMMCVFVFSLSARVRAQDQMVTLKVAGAPFTKVISELKRQTQLDFFYSFNEVDVNQTISLNVKNVKIDEVLKRLLGSKFTWEYIDRMVIIKPASLDSPEKKSLRVKGFVYDMQRIPIPGVTVKVAGVSLGTATDARGWFAMDLPVTSGTLEFSFVGFKTQKVNFTEKTDTLRITLEEDIQTLDETVVVAYGTTTRREMTGAISTVKGEDLEGIPSPNIATLLQGRVAGMDITNISGAPGGGGAAITIRGYNSLDIELERRFSNPLWVVDGVPLNSFTSPITGTNLLSDINPDMIESIEVLKDASSAAIYGSRAANGVIIVTTKKGRQNQKSSLSVNVSQSWSVLPELPTIMVGRYERDFRLKALRNELIAYLDMENLRYKYPETWEENYLHPGGTMDALMHPVPSTSNGLFFQDSLNDFYNNATNFFPMYYHKGKVTNANIQSYGGSEKIAYSLGLGYYDESGILKGSGFNRIDLNSSMNIIPVDKLTVDLRLNASLANRKQGYGSFSSSFQSSPMIGVVPGDPYYLSSLYPGEGSAVWDYIVDQMKNIKEKNRSIRLRTNFKLGYEIIKGLQLSTSLAADYSLNRRNGFTPSYLMSTNRSMSVGETGISLMVLNENLLSYKTIIDENHNVSAVAGLSYQYDQTEYNGGSGENSPSDQIYYVRPGFPDLGDEQLTPSLSRKIALQHYLSDMTEQVLISYFARLEYNYKKKYLFSASIRRDGSSTFGEHKKWGTFPSVAAAWTFSEEGFIRNNLEWFNFGKIRASWGRSGMHFSQNYLALGIMNVGSTSYLGNSYIEPQWGDGLYNDKLSWEETDQYDFGLDLDMFDHRLGITIDYYYRYTDKLLDRVRLPSAGINTGYQQQWRNAAAVSNEGLEVMVKYEIFRKSDLYWKISVNAARNWNRFEKSYTGKDLDLVRVIGKSLNGIYALKTDGYVDYQDEVPVFYNQIGIKAPLASEMGSSTFYKPGDYKFIDVDGNRKITAFDDEVYCGSALPKVSGGIVNEFQWKNFDVNILLSFQLGRHMLNITQTRCLSGFGAAEYPTIVMNLNKVSFWEKPGDKSDFPKWQYDWDTYLWGGRYVDRRVEKVNWLKIKTVSIGYTLPKAWMQKCGLDELRIFASGENLHTFTNYSGIEPEIVDIRNGEDVGSSYPLARKLTLGLTLKF